MTTPSDLHHRPPLFGGVRASDLFLPANVLSLARLPLAAAFPIALAWDRGAAVAVLALAAATDMADGFTARTRGEVTATGALVDPICDKVFALVVLVALLAHRTLSIFGAAALAAREIFELPLALFVLFRNTRSSQPRMSNALGKLATAAQFMVVASAIAWREALPAALASSAIAGVGSGISYWAREVRAKSVARPAPGSAAPEK